MGNGFICLTPESYNLIRQLNRKNAITKETYLDIEDCQSGKELEKILRRHLAITDDLIGKIWLHLVMGWLWDRNDKEQSTVFNEWQNIFIKKLLLKNGVYAREECQKEILTDQQISNHVLPLEEQKIIISIRTTRTVGDKTVYVIHPELTKKVKHGI